MSLPVTMTRAYQSTIKRNAYITLVSNTVLAVMRSHFIFKCILLFNMVPPVVSMPGHYDYDRLPPMHDGQDNKLMWDGIPSPYFLESFYQPLQNASATLSGGFVRCGLARMCSSLRGELAVPHTFRLTPNR